MLQAETKTQTVKKRLLDTVANRTTQRVLLIAHSLSLLGGQSIQAKRLLDRFAEDAPEIEAGFLPNDPKFENFLSFFQNFKYIRTILTNLKFIFILLKQIRNFDLIQVFSASNTSYLISTLPPLFIGKLFGKKVILNYHSGEASDHFERWARIVRPTLKRFDRIVVPSEYLSRVFRDFGFEAEIVPNFVDAEIFEFREKTNPKPIFLSNRNLEPLYNVEMILRAFQLIREKYSDAELLIAGSGRERQKLERTAKELKLENVYFLGAVSPEEMPELYRRASVYLNSSNIDNMPLSILEAFSSGTPVVTTNAGGIPFLVEHGETGLMVEREDFRALAREAIRILEDENLRRKIVRKARAASLEKYSWQAVKNKWLEVYGSLRS
jgi:Glycosyltransferase